MRAVVWHGKEKLRVEDVPEPRILNPRDAIIRVTSTAICGSDLHLYDGFIPTMKPGDILGHEFMGEVVEVGPAVHNLSVGDRVVVPFPISCGGCFFCTHGLFASCDNTNPNAWMAEEVFGYSAAGIFGYSHLFGGYAGGQAEFVRVPMADVGPIKVPKGVPDQAVLFLSDVLPTGWMAAENCNVKPGDTVAVWGCGPIGQLAIACLRLMGAERIIAIDNIPERLALAARVNGAEPLNFEALDGTVYDRLRDMTGGRGPDSVLDAVGMEAHVTGVTGLYDRAKQALMLESDRPAVLRQAINCCRKGGTVSLIGVYSGFDDKIPLGAAFNKGLTIKQGQAHAHRYLPMLLDHILAGRLDPAFIITHHLPLDVGPEAYRIFRDKEDGCIKVVMDPTRRVDEWTTRRAAVARPPVRERARAGAL